MVEIVASELMALAVLALSLLAAGLVALLLLHHARVGWRLRWTRRRTEALLPSVCRAVCAPERAQMELRAARPSDRGVLLPLLVQLALDLRGEESQQVSRLAAALGLSRVEERRLRSRRIATRMQAAKNLGLLRVRTALPALLHLLKSDPCSPVRVAGVWALGEIGGRRAILGLLSMLEDPVPAVVRRAQEVMIEAAPDATQEIVDYLRRSSSPGARCAAVEVLGALRDPVCAPLLLELMQDADPELRIKATRAAAGVAAPSFLDAFERLLSDPLWQVRCQAATGLGALGRPSAIPRLRAALADPAWWVRFNAARSLHELGAAGREELERALRTSDPTSRDVAHYVLARSGSLRVAA